MNNIFKRTVSSVLALAMLFTMACFSGIVANAAVEKVAGTVFSDLNFVVPEAIYLYPNGSSDKSATSTPFQYYINNSQTGTALTAYDTTGKIYFSYTNATGTALTYRFLNRYMDSTLSGGSVSLSTTSPGTYATINITGGTSPSLAADVSGCYIEWKMSFTDSTDKKAKTAYAYTYVYKPYTVPVGGFARAKNEYYDDNWCQSLAWMSGVHSIKVGTLHDNGGYYPKRKTGWGFASFITAGDKAYVGSTSYNSGYGKRQQDCWNAATKYSGSALWKLAFVNTGESSDAHFDTNRNNDGPISYGKTSADSETYSVRSMDYWYKDTSPSGGNNLTVSLTSGASGNITIDTSRYSNLKDIPNLGIGLMLTDNEDGQWGNWYIGDATDRNDHRDCDYWSGADKRGQYWADKNYTIAGVGTSATDTSSTDSWDEEGVQYAGPWPRTLLGSTGTQGATYRYSFRSWHAAEQDSTATNDRAHTTILIDLNAKYYNKATLRTAVLNATKKMPALGINGMNSIGKPTSCYFDANDSYKWLAFQTAYQKAVRVLGSVDMKTGISDTPATLATALNNALNALCTKVTYNGNGGSLSGTTTVYATIGTAANITLTPAVTASRSGFTFMGWSTDASSTDGSSTITVGYNQTVYAIWRKNVSAKFWRVNGTTSSAETVNTTIYGSQSYATVTVSQPPQTIVYDGRSMEWLGFTQSTTANASTSYTTGLTYNISGGENYNSLYSGTLLLQFNGNGGTGMPSQQSARQYINANSAGITGDGATFSISTTVPIKAGATFIGWAYSPTATIADFAPGDTISGVTVNTTLYAVWRANVYYVHYIGNGATSGEMDGSTHYYGTASTLNKNMFERVYTVTYNTLDGRANTTGTAVATFTGWANTANGTVAYGDEQTVTNLTKADGATVDLYAKWTLGSVVLPSVSRTGYAFRGWYTNSALTNLAGNAGDSYKPATNITLYAMWDANSYKVVYNGNGATGGSTSISDHVYDQSSPLSPNGFTQVFTVSYNYGGATGGEMPLTATAESSFAGWATTANGSALYYDGENVTNLIDSGSTVLYAKWTNGTVKLPTPQRTGYTFAGWYRDDSFSAVAGSAGTLFAPGDNVTLYAKWDKMDDPKLVPAEGSSSIVNEENHFIYGLPDRDNATYSDLLNTGLCAIADGNGYVTYEYSNEDGVIGTGTKVILHSSDGTVLDSYTVVIFGDNNGDGFIDLSDCIDYAYYDAYMDSKYDYDDMSTANVMAMDVDGDGLVSANDVLIIAYYVSYMIDSIDQTGSGIIHGA